MVYTEDKGKLDFLFFVFRKMDDSDSECYEQLDESISPSNSSYVPKARSATHTGVGDSWRSTSHSPIPYDIDKRPPYPVPKTTTKLLGEGNSYLTYDRITVSPVAPDYEMSSISPPRASYSFPSSGIQKENKPPLPPINPNRKPPSRLVYAFVIYMHMCIWLYRVFKNLGFTTVCS